MPALLTAARRSPWLSWLIDNPLLIREIRRRMRGRLFSWALIGYLAVLGGVSCVLMFVSYPLRTEMKPARELILEVGKIGTTLFKGMCFVEGLIALFLAPMLTAGLATQEKEKDTFDFLRVTTLRSRTFVAGCLLTTAAFLGLIFSCTLPILGLTFIFGGVSMAEILTFNVTLFIMAMAVSSWGIFNSTSYRRARSAQGSIIVLFIVALFFVSRLGFFRAPGILSTTLFGTGPVVSLMTVLVPLTLIVAIFSVAAARRLYEPNNRLFNYKQYTLFYLCVLGLVAGTLAYRTSSLPLKTLDPQDLNMGLELYFFIGWAGLAASILIFSAGRVERGDEVWRLRLKYSALRRLDERILVYALYLAIWLLPSYAMGLAWDKSGEFNRHLLAALPLSLLALVLVWSVAYCATLFSESRNRATVAAVLILVFLGGILPAFGYFFSQVQGQPGRPLPPLMQSVSQLLLDASPVRLYYAIWNDEKRFDLLLPLFFLVVFSILFLLPHFSKTLRRRLDVSYDWTTPAPGQDRDAAEAASD